MTTPARRRAGLEALVGAKGIIRATPPLLLPSGPYFDLAGEEFGRRLLLTAGGDGVAYCLRPDFTLPIVTDYLATGPGKPAAFGYLGPIFRQREEGPAEFDQLGLELLAQPDPDAALDRVFAFAAAALLAYGIRKPSIRLGGVGLFEALLAAADMPAAWRPRIRHRFGHPEAMARLLDRLEAGQDAPRTKKPAKKVLVEQVTEQMLAAGLSLADGRSPGEIADRFLEQQALDAAHVPAATIALFREYLAISGPALQALVVVETFAHKHGLDLSVDLRSLRRHLTTFGPAASVTFETSFSPRLDYYTGIVFEMAGKGGAILASGGQYDRLLERLGAKSRIAASGCAVWVDRLEAEVAK